MLRNSLKFGFSCGVLLIVVFLLSLKLDSNPFVDIRHLGVDVLILGLFITFAIIDFKKSINQGILYFWQGMSIGFIIYFLGTGLFLIYLWAHFQLSPDLLQDYISAATEYLDERSLVYIEKFGEAQYQDQVDSIKAITSGELVFSSAMKKLIAGLFVTPVISIILRKNK